MKIVLDKSQQYLILSDRNNEVQFYERILMPEKTDNLVEVDRNKLVVMGGSAYILVPKFLRRGIIAGVTADKYESVFYRKPGSDQTIIRIEQIEVSQ